MIATQADGLFILNKPAGCSSQQAISKLKKKLAIKKIGHAGTLDPFATGVLVCLINKATKKADQFQAGNKIYSGLIKLGQVSDTDDCTGNVVEQTKILPSTEKILEVAQAFKGKILQVPPKVSAIKVQGVRAYQLQRQGSDFALAAREVEIFESEFKLLAADSLFFRIKTAKGFYVRSFARDLGEQLGCGALLAELCREVSEPFELSHAKSIEDLSWSDLLNSDHLTKGEC
jgi:tRNA pseudouridine55 synthase